MDNNLKRDRFISKANRIHNNKYNYSDVVYVNSHTKVTIICELHGNFNQLPTNHLQGQQCPICGINKRTQCLTKTQEAFVLESSIIHNNKYDYSLVKYINTHTKVDIICPIHGLFSQKPSNHLNLKQGCPKCIVSRRINTNLSKYNVCNPKQKHMVTALKFLQDKEWLKDQYLIKGKTALHISDELGLDNTGSTVGKWLYRHNIPIRHNVGFSQKCIHWLSNIAQIENIEIQHAGNIGEYKISGTRYKVDGYCEETNTIYEFHGDCWHGNPILFKSSEYCNPWSSLTAGELYKQTIQREELIRQLGYNLVVKWETDINKDIK
ncbi:MAG: hypothetical protein EO766_12290 [Hydrotalea sp. AMD]|uniref:hypothetical protein n=1 Tax=Hydrotalea sp. AMD TaxID=2501297 RepID=UPI001024F159|nr:hypothetical protein [Hydrotalea sp. AMD]RWZ87297.1 MAG: hypothetical protein EO766_12290 [Hydrotalea sp. AMD]